jgi:hypothetical protein
MRKSNSSRWFFVSAFVVIGLLNLTFNPFTVQTTRASNDCDGDPPCCVNGSVQAQCEDGEWVCP